MKPNEARNLLAKIIGNSIKKQRSCLFPGCYEKSIASHLLQKNGILSSITEKNHLYTYFTNYQTNESKFKLTGKNEAFTFLGYCSFHDNHLFKTIEKADIDFSDTTNNLLFTFRAIFNELRKKEIFNEGFSNALKSKTLDGFLDRDQLNNFIRNNSLGERDLKHHLSIAHNDYINETISYHFDSFRVSKIPICVSATISVETDLDMITQALADPEKWASFNLPSLIINFFPLENESIMLIAYAQKNSEKISEFVKNNILPIEKDKSLKKLSDLIIKYTETWACSPSFYNSFIKKNEIEIIKSSNMTTFHRTNQEIPVNIFEGYGN